MMCLFVFSFAIEHDKFLSYGFGHYDASLFEALLPRQQVGGLKRVEHVAELFFQIGKIITMAIKESGIDGVINIEDSNTMETWLERV